MWNNIYAYFLKSRIANSQMYMEIYSAKQTVNVYISGFIAFMLCGLLLLFFPQNTAFVLSYFLTPAICLLGLLHLRLTSHKIERINFISFLFGVPAFLFAAYIIELGFLYLPLFTIAMFQTHGNVNSLLRGRIFSIIIIVCGVLAYPFLVYQQIEHITLNSFKSVIPQLAIISAPAIIILFFFDLFKNKIAIDLNHSLEKSNAERGILLKEIHHRVKNNLQLLLSISRLKNKNGKIETHEIEDSILSIFKAYEAIYKSESLNDIPLEKYINQVMSPIAIEHNFTYQIDSIMVNKNIDFLIPIGLIITELTNNSIKHGGVKSKDLKIFIKATIEDEILNIFYKDNGIGYGKKLDSIIEADSFGITIIEGLSDQLNGSIKFFDSEGACAELKINNKP